MKPTRIVFAPSAPEGAMDYLIVDEAAVIERGSLDTMGDVPTPMPTVLVVSGAQASAYWLNLPTRSDEKAAAAARLHLEDELAVSGDHLHIAVGPLEADGHRLVVVTSMANMRSWLQGAACHSVTPDVIVPDYALLPAPRLGEVANCAQLGGMLVVRGPRRALSIEPDMAALVLADIEVRTIDDPQELDRRLADAVGDLPINLLQGEFDAGRADRLGWRDFRRAAVLAGLLLISPLVITAVSALRYDVAADRANERAAARAAAAVPGFKAGDDPLVAVERQAARLRLANGGGPAGLAAQLFTAVSAVEEAQLESLLLMPGGEMRGTISHADYSQYEALQAELSRVGVSARQEAVREDGGRIFSDVIIGVRP